MNKPSVFGVTSSIIKILEHDLQSSTTKAALSAFRNSVNVGMKDGVILSLMLEKLPVTFLGRNGIMTNQEKAILNTLQMYAIHQQGNSTTVNSQENVDDIYLNVRVAKDNYFLTYLDNEGSLINLEFDDSKNLSNKLESIKKSLFKSDHSKDKDPFDNIGKSLKNLRHVYNDSTAIDRRFNAMITSSNYDELLNHLRSLIRIMRSKTDNGVNYPQLAKDLNLFLVNPENQERIKLQWAQSYYAR